MDDKGFGVSKKLPKKSAGRPARAGEPAETTGVRLTAGELATIDRAAELLGKPRGVILRDGAMSYALSVIRDHEANP